MLSLRFGFAGSSWRMPCRLAHTPVLVPSRSLPHPRHACDSVPCRHKYLPAFLLARRHRVNLNLLCDIDPSYFAEPAKALVVVDQIKKEDYLTLLLTELRYLSRLSALARVLLNAL